MANKKLRHTIQIINDRPVYNGKMYTCLSGYHWSFVLYDVTFIMYNKLLLFVGQKSSPEHTIQTCQVNKPISKMSGGSERKQ